jgi:ribosome-associated protein
MINVPLKTEEIKLDQFLKWANIVGSGGEAKALIQSGKIKVNGIKETRRAHLLNKGDVIEIEGIKEKYRVSS